MNGKDLVSVIIPTYQRPENLIRAIESVLTQTYKTIEIIVVDDNGKGTEWQLTTEKLLKDYIVEGKIQYICHKENLNGSAARNTGFKASKGEYINFLDDDDVFSPEKIEKQLFCLKSYSEEFGACICNTDRKGIRKSVITSIGEEGNLIEKVLVGEIDFNTSVVLFRRKALEEINGFDESFRRHQDWELYVRFFRAYKVCLVKDILLTKYQTPNILTDFPLKAIEYKEKFFNTFKEDFEKMIRRNQVYRYQYELLALFLLSHGYKREGIRYAKKAFHYGIPPLGTFIRYIYHLFRFNLFSLNKK